MRQSFVFTTLSLTALGAALGCTETPSGAPSGGPGAVSPATEPASTAPADEPTLSMGPVVAEKGGIKVSKLAGSPAFPDAALSMSAPPADGEVEGPEVEFAFDVEDFTLGAQTTADPFIAHSGKGQHIHLIVDNGPYSAHYAPEATRTLEPGSHVVLAFLSRSHHESVKHGYALSRIHVGGKKDEAIAEADLEGAPHLFYSRPKGTYTGAAAEKVMLDFYLVNATLGGEAGYTVEATIEGQTFELTEWVPYVIEGLPMGEVEIALRLLDGEGEPVPGPFNQVERTVTLAAETS